MLQEDARQVAGDHGKCGSSFGSSSILITICVIQSDTTGTSKILTPPDFFGIGTAFTGGGK
jgi:hypothetical protein